MALREELERMGNWLFRWRSYLPILMLGLVVITLRHFSYPRGNHGLDQLWEVLCLALSVFGLGIRMYTIGCVPEGTSGRNVRQQRAEMLNVTGMYSIVRHPLYLGNFFMGFGLSLFPRLWWLSLIYVLSFWLYYERIMFAEEEFLREKFGQMYLDWASRVPPFVPRPKLWNAPSLRFSLRWALRREYSSLFAVIVAFVLLEVFSDYFAQGTWGLDRMWTALLVGGAILYAVVRFLSKRTRFFNVKGR